MGKYKYLNITSTLVVCNMYEEILVTFQNMELMSRVDGKFYHYHNGTLYITLTLRLQE